MRYPTGRQLPRKRESVASTIADIRKSLLDHCVTFSRSQTLDMEQHKAFARRFGKIFVHPNFKGTQADPEARWRFGTIASASTWPFTMPAPTSVLCGGLRFAEPSRCIVADRLPSVFLSALMPWSERPLPMPVAPMRYHQSMPTRPSGG